MFAHRYCMCGRAGMVVIGCCNKYGIYRFAHLIKHYTPVVIPLRTGVSVKYLGNIVPAYTPVYVAKGNNVLGGHSLEIALTHSSNSDPGNVELVTWRLVTQPRNGVGRDNQQSCCSGGGCSYEPSAAHLSGFFHSLFRF